MRAYDLPTSARRLARRTGAAALIVILAVSALVVPAASAAGVTNMWTAKVGPGTATFQAFAGGTGSLAIKVTGLKASITYPITLYHGGCSSVGGKLFALTSQKTTSAGALVKTIALTAGQVTVIKSATAAGGATIRIGAGTLTKCGVLVSQSVTVAVIPLGDQPFGMAASDSAIWITNAGDDTVSRVDPATNTVAATVTVGKGPEGIAIGEGAIWVANADDNTVSRIDPVTNVVVATIPVGDTPVGVATGGGAVWVANLFGSSLSKIDPATNAVSATVAVGLGPLSLAVGENAVWLATVGDGMVARLDPATNAVTGTIPVGTATYIAAGNGSVWVTSPSTVAGPLSVVTRINPATMTVASQIPVGYYPAGLAVSGDSVFVAMTGETSVARISATTGTVTQRIPVGLKSYAVAWAAGSLWALHPLAASVNATRLYDGAVSRVNP